MSLVGFLPTNVSNENIRRSIFNWMKFVGKIYKSNSVFVDTVGLYIYWAKVILNYRKGGNSGDYTNICRKNVNDYRGHGKLRFDGVKAFS